MDQNVKENSKEAPVLLIFGFVVVLLMPFQFQPIKRPIMLGLKKS